MNTLAPLLIVGYVACRIYHIGYHSIMGSVGGKTINPPALAFADNVTAKKLLDFRLINRVLVDDDPAHCLTPIDFDHFVAVRPDAGRLTYRSR